MVSRSDLTITGLLPPTAGPMMIPAPQDIDKIDIPMAWLESSDISYRIVLAMPTVPKNR